MNQIYPVITIQREYAAGGRSVAKLLAEKLNIPWYDNDFIKTTANDSGLSIQDIKKDSEEIGDGEKLFDTLFHAESMHDKVFYTQREVILKLAQSPCIIIGRASNAILKEAGIPALHVYLYSDMKHKIEHAKELHEYGKMSIEKFIAKKDKARANFFEQYTGLSFTDMHNYDISINTALGYETCASVLETFVKENEKKLR